MKDSCESFLLILKSVCVFCSSCLMTGSSAGTLHPNCQDSTGRPRRDIGTILQILNDLLSATRHYQGMPPSLTQLRYQTQCGPGSPSPPPSPTPSPSSSAPSPTGSHAPGLSPTSVPSVSPASLHPLVQCQSQIRMCKSPGKCSLQCNSRGPHLNHGQSAKSKVEAKRNTLKSLKT